MLCKKLEDIPLLSVDSVVLDDNDWTTFVPDDSLITDWWSSVGGGTTDLMDWINFGGNAGVIG